MSANELDVAHAIARGEARSPSPMGEFTYFALRITGTGLAERPSIGELAHRPASEWLTDEMAARCAGLPVVLEHPPSGVLDSDQYAARNVGAISFAYPATSAGVFDEQGNELWAIAKVYDAETIAALTAGQISTSPSASFTPGQLASVTGSDGSKLTAEGKPAAVSHVALVPEGVWDRGNPGVRIDNQQEPKTMADEKLPSATTEPLRDTTPPPEAGAQLDKILEALGTLITSQDVISKRLDALESDDDEAGPDEDDGSDKPGAPVPVAADSKKRKDAKRVDADDPEERAAKGTAQARADALAMQHSEKAPPPMMAEGTLPYRIRLAKMFQRHSPDFAKVDLYAVAKNHAAFDAVENRIYADAAIAARSPDVPAGHLREIKRRDQSGREISEFFGDPSTWMSPFRGSRRVLVKPFFRQDPMAGR